MLNFRRILILVCVFVSCISCKTGDNSSASEGKDVYPRGGWPNFIGPVKNQKGLVTVALCRYASDYDKLLERTSKVKDDKAIVAAAGESANCILLFTDERIPSGAKFFDAGSQAEFENICLPVCTSEGHLKRECSDMLTGAFTSARIATQYKVHLPKYVSFLQKCYAQYAESKE